MITIDNSNYLDYIKTLVKGREDTKHCLKCNSKLHDYGKVKRNKQSGIEVTNVNKLCENCNLSNQDHSFLHGRQGI